MEKSGLLIGSICVVSFLDSLFNLSWVSAVFDFNASLNDVAPLSPMLLPVDLKRMEKSGLCMDSTCVVFIFTVKMEF